MLERNARLKPAPERWQAETAAEFDVVVAFEERVFAILAEDLAGRGGSARPVLLLNLDTKDNAAEAAAAAPLALQLCQALAAEGPRWAAAVERLLTEFQATTGRPVLYRIGWYGS
jgi:RNA polymerase II subunit A C-terminal domain phosphatase SSU72